jgi:hypothetical protein
MAGDEMPQRERPLSAIYYEVAKRWVELDGAARMLEECKTATLAQHKKKLGDIPDNKAETAVKASQTWMDYLTEMVNTRTAANEEKVKMEYIRIRHAERQSMEASARHEARLDK